MRACKRCWFYQRHSKYCYLIEEYKVSDKMPCEHYTSGLEYYRDVAVAGAVVVALIVLIVWGISKGIGCGSL